MNLLDSLLDAIARLHGDALVMHVGEKPYVITTSEVASQFRGPLSWGHVELSSRVLTLEAVTGMLGQILPADQRAALDGYGAIEYEVTSPVDSLDRFTIVAARGGDDIWVEVRRHRQAGPHERSAASPAADVVARPGESVSDPIEAPHLEAAARTPGEGPSHLEEVAQAGPSEVEPEFSSETPASAHPAPEPHMLAPSLYEDIPVADNEFIPEHLLSSADSDWGDEVMTEGDLREILRASAGAVITGEGVSHEYHLHEAPDMSELEVVDAGADDDNDEVEVSLDDALHASRASAVMASAEPDTSSAEHEPGIATHETLVAEHVRPVAEEAASPALDLADASRLAPPAASVSTPSASGRGAPEDVEQSTPVAEDDASGKDEGRARPAIVVPLARHTRPDVPSDARGGVGTLERLLRLAAARGAAAVYVVAQSAPMVRVDGEFSALDGEPAFSAAFVDRLTAEIAPSGPDDAATPAEWTIDVPEIGRVRCMSFRDYRGAGLIFRMVPQRAISADQLALSPEVQALCSEAEGLVLVAGTRGSGKSTLLTSFVDLINRTRSDHVITVESQIDFVHENRRSFISQREVRGDSEAMTAAVRTACREDPDVLIVEDLRSPELVTLALEAAQAGRLVFASVPAPSALAAIERITEMFPPERREKTQAMLAGTLRGVVSQVLLRKLKGGRVAAREVLLNTPAVANLILEGKTFQLPAALESGRRLGMMSLAESLASLVREGTVHPSHAYRKAPNREQFLTILRRDGVDTSIAERLA